MPTRPRAFLYAAEAFVNCAGDYLPQQHDSPERGVRPETRCKEISYQHAHENSHRAHHEVHAYSANEYCQAVDKMESIGVQRDYGLGWIGGYMNNPKIEEQRITGAYEKLVMKTVVKRTPTTSRIE